jgi:hypothetical protein
MSSGLILMITIGVFYATGHPIVATIFLVILLLAAFSKY